MVEAGAVQQHNGRLGQIEFLTPSGDEGLKAIHG
jgi:hypothetical protein